MKKDDRDKTMTINLGSTERILSLVGGSLLMVNALGRKKRRVTEALTAGYFMFRGGTGHCALYEAAGYNEGAGSRDRSIHAGITLTVNKPRSEVFEFWHKFENLPLFMKHLEKVDVLDDKLSEWTAKLPGKAGTLSWTAEMTKEIRNELIEWTSLPDSAIENSGRVQFRDAGKYGTEVKVHIQYQAPLGTPGEGVLSLLNPVFKYLLKEDIRNFKRYMETGEIPTVEGQTSGRLSVDSHQTEKEKKQTASALS